MAGIHDAFVVNTKSGTGASQLNANAQNGDTKVSDFVTAQSFATFSVASAVLKLLWELLQKLGGGWADSYWTPVVMCLIYGTWMLVISVAGKDKLSGLPAILSAVVTTVANAGILAAAIIGLTETGVGS
jgi:hypothetical protein